MASTAEPAGHADTRLKEFAADGGSVMALQRVAEGEMRAEYDPGADALHVYFSDREYSHGRDIDPARRIDHAADGSVVGVEILSPTAGVDLSGLPAAGQLAALLQHLGLPVTQMAV
jgi:uncharacterized protein YuzE